MAIDSFRWSGCGDFILTISIAFFYPFGLTSIVMLHRLKKNFLKGIDIVCYRSYNNACSRVCRERRGMV